MIIRKELTVAGQVQGIGFRPFIYKLAKAHNLTGVVYNNTSGVCIQLQGRKEDIAKFTCRLTAEPSEIPLMRITSIVARGLEAVADEQDFVITPSESQGDIKTQVTADIATCRHCLAELFDRADFRYQYPFINCTNCGPRYSIIKTVPYDRPNTTMSDFKMCRKCDSQYTSITDRRFHAQPVACPSCGPAVCLTDNAGKPIETDSQKAIRKAAEMLLAGQVLAIKGLGGFHLVVDAQNEEAVKKLRQRKRRDHKPLAMMCLSVEIIKRYAEVDEVSAEILKSPQAPIVLLPKKTPSRIAPSVASGLNQFGFMLAYTPLHHLLLSQNVDSKKLLAIVATSGNISDEPLICDNDAALARLGDIAEAFLTHNRDIYRQVDDSVMHVIDNAPVVLRRARGFVPSPILAADFADKQILAFGSDLKNTFCLAKANNFIVSEHIGDLAETSVYKHWRKSIDHLAQLFQANPTIMVCDMHPGYLSSNHARKIKNAARNICENFSRHQKNAESSDVSTGTKDVKLIEVQHHWAHVASVIAEHRLENPAEKVIGLVADGTGYGSDQAVWGCECLIASLQTFQRFAHLSYFPLGGGDIAAKQAIRPILGLAHRYDLQISEKLLAQIEPDKDKINIINAQLQKNINTVQTSSLGRVFDAAAGLCGLGRCNNFEAQLPMTLEAIAEEAVKDCYPFRLQKSTIPITIDIKATLEAMLADIEAGTDAGIISARFHNTIAEFFCSLALEARNHSAINTAAISGGVFCNRYLLTRLNQLLKQKGFRVLFNRLIPSNDGGISLGQAAIAAALK